MATQHRRGYVLDDEVVTAEAERCLSSEHQRIVLRGPPYDRVCVRAAGEEMFAGTHGELRRGIPTGTLEDRVAALERGTAARGVRGASHLFVRIDCGVQRARPPLLIRPIADRRHDEQVARPRGGHIRNPLAFLALALLFELLP